MKWAYIGNNLITWSAKFIIHKLGGGSSVCFWITDSLKLYTQAADLCQKKLKFEIIFWKIWGAISKTTVSMLGLFVPILLCLFMLNPDMPMKIWILKILKKMRDF